MPNRSSNGETTWNLRHWPTLVGTALIYFEFSPMARPFLRPATSPLFCKMEFFVLCVVTLALLVLRLPGE